MELGEILYWKVLHHYNETHDEERTYSGRVINFSDEIVIVATEADTIKFLDRELTDWIEYYCVPRLVEK